MGRKLDAPTLQLADHDLVDESNLASQGYREEDLGRYKVDATADLCWAPRHDLQVEVVPGRFRRTLPIGDVIFSAVDSLGFRRFIWESVKNGVRLFVDGRMTAEMLRILTAYDSRSRAHYPTTLFAAEVAYQGTCTASTTIYCANVATALILAQLTKHLRGLPVDPDIQFNLLSTELTVAAA